MPSTTNTDRVAIFQGRKARYGALLEANLKQLYGHLPGFDQWLGELEAMLAAKALARPPELAQLDLRREATPNWFLQSDVIGYSAYVDRFSKTLPGLAARIDYLRDLGVRYLHLLPFWKTREGDSDGGFAVADFMALRADLGVIDDLDAIAAKLRAADISLCVDLVLNHAAEDHPWALAAQAGDARYRNYFHVFDDKAQVDAYERDLAQVFPSTAPGNFTFNESLKAWVWTTFYPFQWDLNWANPQVFTEMTTIILDLANRGAEAFRLDSAAYLWKRLGTSCRGEPEAHLVLQAIRAIVSIVAPAVMLKSEVIAPVAETVKFLGSPAAPECQLAYHSGLMTAGWAALAEGDADFARAVLADAPNLPPGAGWITYTRCHDDIGWMALAPQAAKSPEAAQARLKRVADFFTGHGPDDYARGVSFQTADGVAVHGLNGMAASLTGLESAETPAQEAAAIDRLSLLYALTFAAGGVPVIYMGDELGQTNDYAFEHDPLRAHEGRWLHRPTFDEARAAETADLTTTAGRIRARLRVLTAARRSLPELSPVTVPALVDGLPQPVLGFWRGGDHVALFNFSSQPQTVALDGLAGAAWKDLLTGEAVSGALDLKGYGSAWLERN